MDLNLEVVSGKHRFRLQNLSDRVEKVLILSHTHRKTGCLALNYIWLINCLNDLIGLFRFFLCVEKSTACWNQTYSKIRQILRKKSNYSTSISDSTSHFLLTWPYFAEFIPCFKLLTNSSMILPTTQMCFVIYYKWSDVKFPAKYLQYVSCSYYYFVLPLNKLFLFSQWFSWY